MIKILIFFTAFLFTDNHYVEPVCKQQSVITKHIFYKIGKAYKKHGYWYRPCLNEKYAKKGLASWYGKEFHGKLTANGDIFDKETITAAHPTLPLFSRIWVTNLENNKRILVTVNDRGPYHKDRLIDLSQKAAKLLDFEKTGTAKVKIVYDKAETEKYLKQIGLYQQYLVVNNK